MHGRTRGSWVSAPGAVGVFWLASTCDSRRTDRFRSPGFSASRIRVSLDLLPTSLDSWSRASPRGFPQNVTLILFMLWPSLQECQSRGEVLGGRASRRPSWTVRRRESTGYSSVDIGCQLLGGWERSHPFIRPRREFRNVSRNRLLPPSALRRRHGDSRSLAAWRCPSTGVLPRSPPRKSKGSRAVRVMVIVKATPPGIDSQLRVPTCVVQRIVRRHP